VGGASVVLGVLGGGLMLLGCLARSKQASESAKATDGGASKHPPQQKHEYTRGREGKQDRRGTAVRTYIPSGRSAVKQLQCSIEEKRKTENEINEAGRMDAEAAGLTFRVAVTQLARVALKPQPHLAVLCRWPDGAKGDKPPTAVAVLLLLHERPAQSARAGRRHCFMESDGPLDVGFAFSSVLGGQQEKAAGAGADQGFSSFDQRTSVRAGSMMVCICGLLPARCGLWLINSPMERPGSKVQEAKGPAGKRETGTDERASATFHW
jgi:hypothetical protein